MLSDRLFMKEVADFISSYPEKKQLIYPLLQLSSDRDQSIAFRASWYLEQVIFAQPESFTSALTDFLTRLPYQENHSVLRHFTKILMFVQNGKGPTEWVPIYQNADHKTLTECHFEWLVAPEIPVAVKANCMEVLENLIEHEPWIKDELILQIQFLVDDGSPAIWSRGQKVLKRLSKKRNQNKVSGLR
jgi:hypothetical protein